jgi:hypothetical protein
VTLLKFSSLDLRSQTLPNVRPAPLTVVVISCPTLLVCNWLHSVGQNHPCNDAF